MSGVRCVLPYTQYGTIRVQCRSPGGVMRAAVANAEIREGTHLRMNGPKKVMEEIKAHEGPMMVGITGLMKKEGRCVRTPLAASAALASKRRPSTSRAFVPWWVAARRGERACVEGRRYFVLKYAAIVEPSNAVSCTT